MPVRILYLLLILVGIVSCSEHTEPNPDAAGLPIEIRASLGAIALADYSITKPNGTPISNYHGTTDHLGRAEFSYLESYQGPIVVTVTGHTSSSYFDEAQMTSRPFDSHRKLRTYLPFPQQTIAVTALTELSAGLLSTIKPEPTAEHIIGVNKMITVMFAPDIADITSHLTLIDNATTGQLGDNSHDRYALRLAALTYLADDPVCPQPSTEQTLTTADSTEDDTDSQDECIEPPAVEQPVLTLIEQLSRDLVDGDIDGNTADGPVAEQTHVREDGSEQSRSVLRYNPSTIQANYLAALHDAAQHYATPGLSATTDEFSTNLQMNIFVSLYHLNGTLLPGSHYAEAIDFFQQHAGAITVYNPNADDSNAQLGYLHEEFIKQAHYELILAEEGLINLEGDNNTYQVLFGQAASDRISSTPIDRDETDNSGQVIAHETGTEFGIVTSNVLHYIIQYRQFVREDHLTGEQRDISEWTLLLLDINNILNSVQLTSKKPETV